MHNTTETSKFVFVWRFMLPIPVINGFLDFHSESADLASVARLFHNLAPRYCRAKCFIYIITVPWTCGRSCTLKTGSQGRRKHLKSGRARSKKGHMAMPINGQSSKRLESIPNQVHTAFGWELKIIDLRVYLKSC